MNSLVYWLIPFFMTQAAPTSAPTSQPAKSDRQDACPTVPKGELHVVLQPSAKVKRVEFFDEDGKPVKPKFFGKEEPYAHADFAGLSAQTRYHLKITLADGGIIQGVDLAPLTKLDRLAKLRQPIAKDAHVFTEEDDQAIREQVEGIEEFEDQIRVLRVQGDGDLAAALVEKIRTRSYYDQKPGQVIWRVEVWRFDYRYGGWVKRAAVEKVLVREELPAAMLQAKNHVFDPTLGGIAVPETGPGVRLEIKIPDKLDPALGRTVGAPIQWREGARKEKDK